MFLNRDVKLETYSRNLPHWRQEGCLYFVTFRVMDSLPQEKLRQLMRERELLAQAGEESMSKTDRIRSRKLRQKRIQGWLDAGYGECPLADKRLASIVARALDHFNGLRYDLDEWVVASNHVHVLVAPREGNDLSQILHSWKSYTAQMCNRERNLSGTFWMDESFDHIVRSQRQLDSLVQYIKSHRSVLTTA